MQATGVNPAGVVADSLKGKASSTEKEAGEVGVNVLNLDDIIVNPTGTNGQRLLLASVGVDLPNKEELDGLQKKKEILTDIVISALSSKSINQLNSIAYRDTIKAEITNSISKKIPNTKINSIYFSKFIIQ
jgi:flagellar FliL protein